MTSVRESPAFRLPPQRVSANRIFDPKAAAAALTASGKLEDCLQACQSIADRNLREGCEKTCRL